MSTPAEIRRDRKLTVRMILKSQRTLDTLLEKNERFMHRIVKLKKRFPDQDDAIKILENLRAMDSQLDVVIGDAQRFEEFVRLY